MVQAVELEDRKWKAGKLSQWQAQPPALGLVAIPLLAMLVPCLESMAQSSFAFTPQLYPGKDALY